MCKKEKLGIISDSWCVSNTQCDDIFLALILSFLCNLFPSQVALLMMRRATIYVIRDAYSQFFALFSSAFCVPSLVQGELNYKIKKFFSVVNLVSFFAFFCENVPPSSQGIQKEFNLTLEGMAISNAWLKTCR